MPAMSRPGTDLVSGISHDLRTPLTSVKGYLKGMRDGVANTPEKREQYLEVAYRKSCEMGVLLQRLFYFSKLRPETSRCFSVTPIWGTFGPVCPRPGRAGPLRGPGWRRGGPAPTDSDRPGAAAAGAQQFKGQCGAVLRRLSPGTDPHRLAAAGPGVHPLCRQRQGCRMTSFPPV